MKPMIIVDKGDFDYNNWNTMVVAASQSRGTNTPRHICRMHYTDGTCSLELKTDKQMKAHTAEHGRRFNSGYAKLPCNEIINLTRISILKRDPLSKQSLKKALKTIAERTDEHYQGCFGTIRKLISLFFNQFTTDSVVLYNSIGIEIKNNLFQRLPFVVGNNADFARLVAKSV